MIRRSIWKPFFAFASLCAAVVMPADLMAQSPSRPIVIVALGDSLTAGYQLPPDASFPAQLEKALRSRGADVKVINAGNSGDTAADGAARLDWSTPEDADAIIVELGANDALRGIPVSETTRVLDGLLARIAERKLPVLLTGMEAPRNWGADYVTAFRAMYGELAGRHGAIFYPFFLAGLVVDGKSLDRKLLLPDGLHPTSEGVAKVVEGIMPSVEELIARARKKREERS